MNAPTAVAVAIMLVVFAFGAGHTIGYSRGLKRMTCPTCCGRGSVDQPRPEGGDHE